MDNMEESENNMKISDSAYSNSCSNSQSRRSHSSKSTHSGSHSSGSSGYGGKDKPSTKTSSDIQPPNKDHESKKKQQSQNELAGELASATELQKAPVAELAVKEEPQNVVEKPLPDVKPKLEKINTSTPSQCKTKEELEMMMQPGETLHYSTSCLSSFCSNEGFSCVISMHDGVVLYTTTTLTTVLGFPKDMWIGRSFIDFVHPKDRNTFASQITNGLAVPKEVNGAQNKGKNITTESTMVCRIRQYRKLIAGFRVKERTVTFMPFLLKLSFKNICNDEDAKVTYLVIMANPFFPAYKVPTEILTSSSTFVIRHSAKGNLEYIDPDSVPYLGYLPQDVQDMNALTLYHDEDLPYLREIYEKIVKEGTVSRSDPYRMKAQNGDYVKLETEWSSFINPWSKKLEFVIGKHFVVEGPLNPNVFQNPEPIKDPKISVEERNKALGLRESIIKIMDEVLTKPAELAQQCITKSCQDISALMENLIAEQPKSDDDLRIDTQDTDQCYERDSVMLGGISPHHDYNDSKSSTETPLSYNQLNYNENMQRYFDSHQPNAYEIYNTYHILGIHSPKKPCFATVPPGLAITQDSGETNDLSSRSLIFPLKVDAPPTSPTNSLATITDYNPVRLTEVILKKHNTEMEKELIKSLRESRSSCKRARKNATNETRQKKKEHLARCNASFQPTLVEPQPEFLAPSNQIKSVKRSCQNDGESNQTCPLRKARRRRTNSHPNETTEITAVDAKDGMIPMYYNTAMGQIPSCLTTNSSSLVNPQQFLPQLSSCMRYGQAIYGQTFLYSPVDMQASQSAEQAALMYPEVLNPLSLGSKNYEGVIGALPNSFAVPSNNSKTSKTNDTPDRTDGESSYSSFYSSFFKTDSGSAEDSGDHNKKKIAQHVAPRIKMEAPWLAQVCVTSDLVYKYQILSKSLEEVLEADINKIATLLQPSLVNEQLDQLYLDLQLEGETAKLTLEKGITSSSSSEEDAVAENRQNHKHKRDHSKLVIIYEEDASLPPPSEEKIQEYTDLNKDPEISFLEPSVPVLITEVTDASVGDLI